ncbi:MAG: aldo/keto reductase, partial [Planctomycetota bacterium]
MQYRPLGTTGISVSTVSFGAGPVSGLLTGDAVDTQRAVVQRAVELGVNWFDTAAGYGNGQSELHLGAALSGIRSDQPLHVATKVRVELTTQTDLRPLVVASVKESLSRLNLPRVTLLQIHNSITLNRLDQPTSITPEDVLGPRGLLAGMQEVRAAGWVDQFGLTGIGDAKALCTVMRSQEFATIQAPVHFLNPSALRPTPSELCDPDFGGFLRTAHELGMGIFAIRVFAAGALLGAEPSPHTFQTPFFPLDLYRRDEARVRQLSERLLCEAPGLRVAFGIAEFEWDADLISVAEKHARAALDADKRARVGAGGALLGLGVTAACTATGLPASAWDEGKPISAESAARLDSFDNADRVLRRTFERELGDFRFPYDLDKLGRSLGEDSHIAVLHADGNGFGVLRQNMLAGFT